MKNRGGKILVSSLSFPRFFKCLCDSHSSCSIFLSFAPLKAAKFKNNIKPLLFKEVKRDFGFHPYLTKTGKISCKVEIIVLYMWMWSILWSNFSLTMVE